MHPIKQGFFAVMLGIAALVLIVAPLTASAQPLPPEPDRIARVAPEVEEVTSFASDITVRTDGVIEVVERIDYNFPSPRHGIYRTIPVRYDRDGKGIRIPIKNVQVAGAMSAVRQRRNDIEVRIGDPDVEITGLQSYVIGYELHGALIYEDDIDRLIFDVTGHDWDVPIRRVAATVHLPDGVDADRLAFRCFTGPYGSTESNCLINRMGNAVQFAAEGPMTVEVDWAPKGLVAVLEPKFSLVESLSQPVPLAIMAVLIPLLSFLYMVRAWRSRGRDLAMLGAIPPQYEPPNGDMKPAMMGIIADERLDHRDLTATVIDLAVRGHVRIEETVSGLLKTKDFELIWLKNDKDTLSEIEELLLKAIFGWDSSVKLSELKSDKGVYRAMRTVRERLYNEAAAQGYFVANPEAVRQKFALVGIIMIVLGFIGFAFNALLFMVLGGAIGVAGLVVIGFSFAMPAKTAKGVDAYRHTLGFREYLERAEKYRLQWQEKENMLESFLPYAMAFGIVEKWTKQINAFGMEMQQPSWYGGTGGAFNAMAFSKSMSSFEAGMRNANTKPGSSSSSGGFSGGGVGGGGGGSW